jgi:hypothetical protein
MYTCNIFLLLYSLILLAMSNTTTTTTQTIVHTFLPASIELIFRFLSYLDNVKVTDMSSMHN